MTRDDWLAQLASGVKIDTSIDAATARFNALEGDESLIPEGTYCYSGMDVMGVDENGFPHMRVKVCPFWARDPDAPHQDNGYCAKMGCGDQDSEGLSLLWDMVKECGIKDDFDAEEEMDA